MVLQSSNAYKLDGDDEYFNIGNDEFKMEITGATSDQIGELKFFKPFFCTVITMQLVTHFVNLSPVHKPNILAQNLNSRYGNSNFAPTIINWGRSKNKVKFCNKIYINNCNAIKLPTELCK